MSAIAYKDIRKLLKQEKVVIVGLKYIIARHDLYFDLYFF